MPTLDTLEHLDAPPIVEVACGFLFGDLPGLDPVAIGSYWHRRRSEYPKHELKAPIADVRVQQPDVEIFSGDAPPLRTWLISTDNDFVIQIQPDRYYFNWRKSQGPYPRFSSVDGGVLKRALLEFERFSEFCATEFATTPLIKHVELTKVDHIREGAHWKAFDELAILVPWLGPFGRFSHSNEPRITMRFAEPRDGGHITVSLDMVASRTTERTRILKLEATARKSLGVGSNAIRDAFVRANAEVNDVFAKLVPKPTRETRFQKQGGNK